MSKMLNIDQIHLRALMIYMSKMGKNIHTHFCHNFLNMIWFECNAIYVKDVKHRSNTPKGCIMLCMSKMGKEHTHIHF